MLRRCLSLLARISSTVEVTHHGRLFGHQCSHHPSGTSFLHLLQLHSIDIDSCASCLSPLPQKAALELCYKANTCLPEGFTFKDDILPHVTLVQAYVAKKDLPALTEAVSSALASFATKYPALVLNISGVTKGSLFDATYVPSFDIEHVKGGDSPLQEVWVYFRSSI